MAFNEIALVGLAWSLAVNPSEADIQKYQSLNLVDQIKIQQLIEQKDALPDVIEQLKSKGLPEGETSVNQSPTHETSTGL